MDGELMALLQEIVTDFGVGGGGGGGGGGGKGKGNGGGGGGARKKEQAKPARKVRKESTKRKPEVVDPGILSDESLWGDGGNASQTSSPSPPKRARTGHAKPAKAVDGDFGEFSGYAKLLTADLDAQVSKRCASRSHSVHARVRGKPRQN